MNDYDKKKFKQKNPHMAPLNVWNTWVQVKGANGGVGMYQLFGDEMYGVIEEMNENFVA